MTIRYFKESDRKKWDEYVYEHPDAYHAHLIGWKDVIEKTYKKKSYYLIAEENNTIVGILPLFYIKSVLFGNDLVSMPYLSYGGVLADSISVELKLIKEAKDILTSVNAHSIELRHPSILNEKTTKKLNFSINTTKVSMRLALTDKSEALFKSFKPKLRSQIRRPQKEGMEFQLGRAELIDDFYKVFTINMRDLGSPVHSKKLFVNIYKYLGESIKVGVIRYKNTPVATGIITILKNMIEIPWASSLREYNKFSPNMLLYWSFLEYSSNNGYKSFDFGRSTPGEGTYKFKEQWGAKPKQLYWKRYSIEKNSLNTEMTGKRDKVVKIWSHIPISISNFIGPLIRKDISL